MIRITSLGIVLLVTIALTACSPFQSGMVSATPTPLATTEEIALPVPTETPISDSAAITDSTQITSNNGTSTTVDATVTPVVPAMNEELAHYLGPNPYTPSPSFDVGYDVAVWEYVEDNGSGRISQLIHRTLPGCSIWLRAGPVGAPVVSQASLAGAEWTIGQVQPNILLYSLPQGDIEFIFGLFLPEPYVEGSKSLCQEAAERVIETFQVIQR